MSERFGEIDQLVKDWGGFSVYDNPYNAYRFGDIMSPCKLSHDDWETWKRKHYVGSSGYDHETGKIINETQREFFDKWYPEWKESPEEEETQPSGCTGEAR